ncbi:helix-turn-helix transcriptional regulator, partial [Dysgonomonas sp. OttesenSCG-928-M03]|nr:helix-turn-helix transcriptional regulator [Dysgonomonas sp. OttesenSCG-928-M03]
YKGISKESFYAETSIASSNFKGKGISSELGGDKIAKILTIYNDLNAEWLLVGKGKMIKEDNIVIANTAESKIESILKYNPETRYEDIISIPIVEIYAAAGQGYFNTDSLIPTGTVDLPKTMFRSSGIRYCVHVKGPSMSPTLQDSDYLIVRHLQPGEWAEMPDEYVYLVVDKDGLSYVKRVKNRFKRGFIVLMSDNIDKSSFPNFNLQADEISNIFCVEWHFSAKMQNINETYYDRLKSLEDRFDDLSQVIKKLNK